MNLTDSNTDKMILLVTIAGVLSLGLQSFSVVGVGMGSIRPVELLLYTAAYMIGLLSYISMVVLEFHVDREYPRSLLTPFAFVGTVFMLIAYGTQNFEYPFPGFFVGIAVIMMIFGLGMAVGWLLWGVSDEALEELRGIVPTPIESGK